MCWLNLPNVETWSGHYYYHNAMISKEPSSTEGASSLYHDSIGTKDTEQVIEIWTDDQSQTLANSKEGNGK